MNNESLAKKPWYLRTWFIALMFALSILVLPLIIGIVLLILQANYEKRQVEKYQMIDDADTYKSNAIIYANNMQAQADSLYQQKQGEIVLMTRAKQNEAETYYNKRKAEAKELVSSAKKKVSDLETQSNTLQFEIQKLENELSTLSNDIFDKYTIVSVDESITSEEYKSRYNLLLLKEKELSKNGLSVNKTSNEISKKIIDNDVKQLLRCFNSETAAVLSSITVKNIAMAKNKIIKTYEILNKLFITDCVEISHDLLEIKLQEADLLYSYEYQKEQEREQQKAIKEQMLEEEKVRREIEKEKAKVEKEEKQFKNEISKLMTYLQKSSDIEKQLYIDKINELEEKLKQTEKDKEDVLNREQNTRAGFVYVISNIGSFGEDVYKIGMTRRLEPMDRINELGNASVPFEFDVHAMIFSDDAPTLENVLHKHFEKNKLNKINPRKEFFKVSLAEIEEVVKENYNGTVTFTKIAEAYQYRESLRLSQVANDKGADHP